MPSINSNIQGLSQEEVASSRAKYGNNKLNHKKSWGLLKGMISLVKEPIVILLLIAASIYFVGENVNDDIFLLSAIILVSTISLYQDSRNNKAFEKLKNFSQPSAKVIRKAEQ